MKQQFRNTSSGTLRMAPHLARAEQVSLDRHHAARAVVAILAVAGDVHDAQRLRQQRIDHLQRIGLDQRRHPQRLGHCCASSRAPGSSANLLLSHCGSPITSTLSSRPAPTGWARNSCGAQLAQHRVRTAQGTARPGCRRATHRRCPAFPTESARCRCRAAARCAPEPAMNGSISTGTSSWNRLRPIWVSVLSASAPTRTSSSTSRACVAWPRTSLRARCVSSVYSITGCCFGPSQTLHRGDEVVVGAAVARVGRAAQRPDAALDGRRAA